MKFSTALLGIAALVGVHALEDSPVIQCKNTPNFSVGFQPNNVFYCTGYSEINEDNYNPCDSEGAVLFYNSSDKLKCLLSQYSQLDGCAKDTEEYDYYKCLKNLKNYEYYTIKTYPSKEEILSDDEEREQNCKQLSSQNETMYRQESINGRKYYLCEGIYNPENEENSYCNENSVLYYRSGDEIKCVIEEFTSIDECHSDSENFDYLNCLYGIKKVLIYSDVQTYPDQMSLNSLSSKQIINYTDRNSYSQSQEQLPPKRLPGY